MSRRAPAAAAAMLVLAACDTWSNPTPAWQLPVADAPWGGALIARGDGFCFAVLADRFDEQALGVRCHGPGGSTGWQVALDARRPTLAAAADGDLLVAAGDDDRWFVEKRDGVSGELRWRYDFQYGRAPVCPGCLPTQRVVDLVATTSGDVVLNLAGGSGILDAQDPGPEPVSGARILVGLSGSTGTRRWREVIVDPWTRIAADGDGVIAVYDGRIERRDRDGVVASTRRLERPLFGNSHLVSGDDGRIFGSSPFDRGYLRAATVDGDLIFDAIAGGNGELVVNDPGGDARGIALSGHFLGNVEVGETTLRHDDGLATESPFDDGRSGTAMPFVLVTDLDGNPRWSAALAPSADVHTLTGATVLAGDQALVLHQTADDGQLWLSAFDVP